MQLPQSLVGGLKEMVTLCKECVVRCFVSEAFRYQFRSVGFIGSPCRAVKYGESGAPLPHITTSTSERILARQNLEDPAMVSFQSEIRGSTH